MATSPTHTETKPETKPDTKTADKAPAAASVATERTPEQREAMAAATIGAQVILDFNDDTSKGARGGAGATIEENTAARDAGLIGLGLDPLNCSGPPLTADQMAARKAAADAASASPTFYPPPSGHATKTSSLAAGIDSGDLPPPPAGSVTGAAAR
jgi:hypothetical protein